MKKDGKIISILMMLIIIVLISVIGIIGFTIYQEIMGEGSLQINFGKEEGFPIIEYKTSEKNNVDMDTSIFSGVEDGQSTSTANQTRYRHLYNQLNDTAKVIYNKLYDNRENLKTGTYTIEFGNTFAEVLSKEQGDQELKKQYQSAIEALIYENPDIYYIDATKMYINIEKITKITGTKYNVYINSGNKINYLAEGFYTQEDVEKSQQELQSFKNQILATLEGKSDYEKLKIIHDYLVETIEYDSTLSKSHIYNIYGALINKTCVCEGYAKAYQYLLNEIGIDNVIVIGTGTNSNNQTENHAWNYVKLKDNWYAVDTTWDDPIIIGGGKLSQTSKYQYFLKGSKTMSGNHIPSGQFTTEGQIFTYPELSIEDYK